MKAIGFNNHPTYRSLDPPIICDRDPSPESAFLATYNHGNSASTARAIARQVNPHHLKSVACYVSDILIHYTIQFGALSCLLIINVKKLFSILGFWVLFLFAEAEKQTKINYEQSSLEKSKKCKNFILSAMHTARIAGKRTLPHYRKTEDVQLQTVRFETQSTQRP
jgi:hypothetical protein